jgi:hypothetical protein
MVRAGRKLDDGLLADHWNAGRDERGQPVPRRTASALYQAWVQDHYGAGPLGEPWGVPRGAEQELGGDRVMQSFTHGIAVYYPQETDAVQRVRFSRSQESEDGSWEAGRDADGQPIPADSDRPIYQAWLRDQRGEGPFGMPWGAPHSRERDHGDGRVTQVFTNGVATHFIHEPDASKQVEFN